MKNRCFLYLGIALAANMLVWAAGRTLVHAIYEGRAGRLLNTLITGQADNPVGVYLGDLNKLALVFATVTLVPLFICSLLPQMTRDKLKRIPADVREALFGQAQFSRPLHRRPVVALLAILFTGMISAIYQLGTARMTIIPETYSTGTATLISGPEYCNGRQCYTLQISCPLLEAPEQVMLRVDTPADTHVTRGTVMFFSGWIGNFWWEWDSADEASRTDEERQIEASHRDILETLWSSGFRTVQVKWSRGWMIASGGSRENPPLLACKPATVTQWVYDNLHTQKDTQAFCGVGHSNGATQIAYMLSRYNQYELFSAVVMEAGPNWTRIDHSCITHNDYPQLLDDFGGRSTIDWAYGRANDGNGPCAQQDTAFTGTFRNTGIFAGPGWTYSYPRTRIATLVGGKDEMAAGQHALHYYKRLENSDTPLMALTTIAEAGHVPSMHPAGVRAITDALLSGCRIPE